MVAKEGAAHNVRANVICPGFVRTPLVDKQIPEMLKETVDGEFTTTDDVADAVLYSPALAAVHWPGSRWW